MSRSYTSPLSLHDVAGELYFIFLKIPYDLSYISSSLWKILKTNILPGTLKLINTLVYEGDSFLGYYAI
jgi:hypothetical protein